MNATSFADFSLIETIQQTLKQEGYVTPTPIQAQAIPHLLSGRDLLGCAQTGTGKTAAFALPILNRLATDRKLAISKKPRVLVLSPTRELSTQIDESFQTYGRGLNLRTAIVIGGVGMTPQIRALAKGVEILVATPGRLLDLMGQGAVKLDGLDTFVLDEADRMLDMGFLPQIEKIVKALPALRQSLFFSATMPNALRPLVGTLLRDPVRVEVAPQSTTAERIQQHVLFVSHDNKRPLLEELLSDRDVSRAIVFSRTKHGADKIARWLNASDIRSDAIHGNKSQTARQRALNDFRDGKTRVLVATDIAARGIDIDHISHVINFDLPMEPESYVHRIGRTARAGAEGVAYTLCEPSERGQLRAIERLINRLIPVMEDHPFPIDPRAIALAPSRSIKPRGPRPVRHSKQTSAVNGAERPVRDGASRPVRRGPAKPKPSRGKGEIGRAFAGRSPR